MPHGAVPREHVGAADRAHPIGKAGALGFLAENGGRHVRIDQGHFLQNGLQNGVVAGVAPAIGTADHHAVPGGLQAAVAAENLLIDVKLRVHGLLDGELGGGLFIELFPQLAAQRVVAAKSCQMLSQGLPISGLEEAAVHA